MRIEPKVSCRYKCLVNISRSAFRSPLETSADSWRPEADPGGVATECSVSKCMSTSNLLQKILHYGIPLS